jgi:hypothetical protein
MTKARDIADFKFENITDTGTEGTKVASGTTAQRGSTTGQLRFNTTTGLAEYYTGTAFKSIDSPPTVTSINPTTASASGVTITVTGTGFSTTGTTQVKIIGTSGTELAGTSVSVTNETTLTFVTPSLTVAEEDWDIKVINPSGLSGILADALDAGASPVFATSAGSLGSLQQGVTDFSGLSSAVATDADGQTVTHTISAGSLPSGMTLNSNGTFAGTSPSSTGTSTFTVSATDGLNVTTREFSITITLPQYLTATGGTITTDGDYKVHTFTSSSNFVVSELGQNSTYGNKVEYLVVGAGAGGGGTHGGGGGAGGYRHNSAYDMTVTAQSYSIQVGAKAGFQSNGSSSSAFGISSAGGGVGGTDSNGTAGGSGGGGSSYPNSYSGASGNTPSTNPSQGNSGGNGQTGQPNYGSGGGGGASSSGGNGSTSSAGAGGNGSSNDIHGSSRIYSAGGGGHAHNNASGAGGSSNVGGSAQSLTDGGCNVATNYGSGGGGNQGSTISGQSTSGNSSQGVVIVRYKFQ